MRKIWPATFLSKSFHVYGILLFWQVDGRKRMQNVIPISGKIPQPFRKKERSDPNHPLGGCRFKCVVSVSIDNLDINIEFALNDHG